MRRICLLIFLLFMFSAVLMTHAQESTPEPPVSTDAERSAERAEDAAARAEDSAQQAQDAVQFANGFVDQANSLLGLFETVTAVTGLLIPVLAIVAGFVGLNRLNSAQNELAEARERFEKEITEKRAELDKVRDDLEANAVKLREELERTAVLQRDDSARATLALALLPLGERQYRAQDYRGALDTYERALALDSDNPVTHYRMGYVHTQSGELNDAVEHLTRALSIVPDFAPALAALGYVYRRIGEKMSDGIDRDLKLNEAEQNLLKALYISPKLIDDDGESWWGSLGGLYRRRGQLDEAINAYTEASQVTPHSSYPFSNLALLYMQKHDRDHMMRMYKRVERLAAGEVQAEVDNYWAYADLLVARLAQGKIKEAEDVLETVVGTAPADSPYMLEMLLDTLERLSSVMRIDEQEPIKRVINYIRNALDERRGRTETEKLPAVPDTEAKE